MSYSPLDIAATGQHPFTDYARWRLRVSEDGRHTWHYLNTDEECRAWPQTDLDKYWLGLPLNLPPLPEPEDALAAARNGYTFYKRLQAKDGHWPGEYGGPMFLLPGLVIGSYVTGMGFKMEEKLEMIRYLLNRTHPEDGGWGMYVLNCCVHPIPYLCTDMLKGIPPSSEPHSITALCASSVSLLTILLS